ncbi:MAG TPA: hypothetical protein VKO20_09030 [Desulfosalsimonadaceae bacterium]|nr:hypothetical protein [Desulfosalsimonadaceae bacterium]
MERANTDLICAVNESVKELQSRVNSHCSLVAAVLEANGEGLEAERLPRDASPCQSHARERQLKQAVQEAITVLEESRKSFKSKQLEQLRRKLTQTLIDLG